jgi:hypothetical protein
MHTQEHTTDQELGIIFIGYKLFRMAVWYGDPFLAPRVASLIFDLVCPQPIFAEDIKARKILLPWSRNTKQNTENCAPLIDKISHRKSSCMTLLFSLRGCCTHRVETTGRKKAEKLLSKYKMYKATTLIASFSFYISQKNNDEPEAKPKTKYFC